MLKLILGGQKSGKSRQAEQDAQAWLMQASHNRVVFLTTGLALDVEMHQRIQRHQKDRKDRGLSSPRVTTIEEPLDLLDALAANSHPKDSTLYIVDCLTLWLMNHQFTPHNDWQNTKNAFLAHLESSQGQSSHVVFVSNEIGFGVVPMGELVREFVDELGLLNQAVAQRSQKVVLMAAGLPLVLKDVR